MFIGKDAARKLFIEIHPEYESRVDKGLPFLSKEDIIVHGYNRRRKRHRLNSIWQGIKSRCLNPNNKHYSYYGGRGIKVSESWKEFINFFNDMNELHEKHIKEHGIKNTQIDRINVNGDYCKDNCRWVTILEQARNRRKRNVS